MLFRFWIGFPKSWDIRQKVRDGESPHFSKGYHRDSGPKKGQKVYFRNIKDPSMQIDGE